LLLKPDGVATFEFPYLINLVRENQFDTIYHEHYSYLSLSAVDRIFRANGLTIIDVESLTTHGGSIRVFAKNISTGAKAGSAVIAMLEEERRLGVTQLKFYSGFQDRAELVKNALLTFLLEQKRAGRKIGAYGAAAKGNTLLNFAGLRSDLLPWVTDRSAVKQGKYLPGSRIPIVDEMRLREEKPDWVLILPWNLRDEIVSQLGYIRAWGGQFVAAVPELSIS
jgi:hypothetical protein